VTEDRTRQQRERLVRALPAEVRDERVLAAMRAVPRERFVPPDLRYLAYEDEPLPIGEGQTISQPTIVAMMTQAMRLEGDEHVLEVGTGSGYQAAVLARLAKDVVTVEIMEALRERATEVLRDLEIANVEVHQAGEVPGWPADAPYDAIIVTAAAPDAPPPLLAQLAVGGRLVIPLGSRYEQELCVVTKTEDGTSVERLGGCRFVPLLGRFGHAPAPERPRD
jgi:protein-L-isoaspartate(D-aspartate) O-methyltransferase